MLWWGRKRSKRKSASPSSQGAYDSLNRLISAQTTATSDQNHPSLAWGQSFTYDSFGSLYAKTPIKGSAPSLSITVNPSTNQISGYGYDSNGNTTYVPGSSPLYMGYDVENRMTYATQSSTPQELYAYDSANRRVWKGTVNSSGVITSQEMYFYGMEGKKLGTYVATIQPSSGYTSYWTVTDVQVHFGARRVAHWAEANGQTQVTLVSTTLDRVGSVRNAFAGAGVLLSTRTARTRARRRRTIRRSLRRIRGIRLLGWIMR